MMRREFGGNWWARQWIEALAARGWDDRLQRGRSYARTGQVRSVDVKPGLVDARVKGSRPRPYVIRISLQPFPDEVWERVLDTLAGEARYAAELLGGEMPPTIEEVFKSVGAHLFPGPDERLITECSCPDWANPCKHIAAVHYVLGSEFDRDPFLLFRLRGRTREAVLSALRARRAVAVGGNHSTGTADGQGGEAELDPPLAAELERFWTLGEEFYDLRFAMEPPRVPEAVLKRLGSPLPPRDGERPVATELSRLYETIADTAMRSAFEDGT